MDFDLRTTDSAYSIVLDILDMSSEQFIDEYILKKLNLQSFNDDMRIIAQYHKW